MQVKLVRLQQLDSAAAADRAQLRRDRMERVPVAWQRGDNCQVIGVQHRDGGAKEEGGGLGCSTGMGGLK
eukprot:142092-Chlamydomonas_euryale.AAC.5